jgi:hypothetical protein
MVGVAVAVLCALPSVIAAIPATPSALGVNQLRQRIVASTAQPFSGYAQSSAALGLPTLPDLADVTGLLSGTTDMRAWYAAPNSHRVDVITGFGERDYYQTPKAEYVWDYGANLLSELIGTAPIRLPQGEDLLPPELAWRILQVDPTDAVSGLPARRIAGVDAAGLRLRPTDPDTRIGQVDIWADPATGLPLRVEVTQRGATSPVLRTAFLDFTPGPPASATLTPPSGANSGFTVATVPDLLGALGNVSRFTRLPDELAGYPRAPQVPGLPQIARYGSGLTSFVVLALPTDVGASALTSAKQAGGTEVKISFGDAELIQVPLLTVLVENRGRRSYLIAGLVDSAVVSNAAVDLATFRGRFR